MARPKSDLPTQGELEILRVLWKQGPSTVREVFRAISRTRKTGLTTVLKLIQIMAEKGLVRSDRSVRPQVIIPTRSEEQIQHRLLRQLADRAFGGSPGNLILQALHTKKATPAELKEIRDLLDQLEKESQ